MGLRIIYGRAGSGKTTFCLNEIRNAMREDKEGKFIFLVPEQFSFEAQKELVRKSALGGIIKSEVLSFERLSYRVFNKEGGRAYPHIHPAGKAIIIASIIEKYGNTFKSFSKVHDKQGFVKSIADIISEFKKYNVTPNDIIRVADKLTEEDVLKQKLTEIYTIYKTFEESIHNKYKDADDDVTWATKILCGSSMLDGYTIWIDGFAGYTKQEYNMIEVLLKKAKRVNITFCLDKLWERGERIDEVDIFARVKRSYKNIIEIARTIEIPVEQIIHLEHSYKFRDNRELYHLEQNFGEYPSKAYPDETKLVSVHMYKDMYSELQDVARNIILACQSGEYRYRDIAIVSRDMHLYQKIIEVVLKENDIPYFVDKRIEMTDNNLTRFVSGVIEIFADNWSYESVFRVLRIGFFDIEESMINKLENYVLSCGIKGSMWQDNKPWSMIPYFMPNGDDSDKMIELLEEINKIRDEVIKPLVRFREKKTVRDISVEIYNLLSDLSVPQKMEEIVAKFNEEGQLEKGSEYAASWDMLMDCLDHMVLLKGDEVITMRKFLELFRLSIREYSIGIIPMGQDQVFVGSAERSKSHNIRMMYLVGVNDGIFPAKGRSEGILSDDDRHVLEDNNVVIAKDTKVQAFDEQFLIYETLTVPSDVLHISYAMKDLNDKPLRQSIIIARLEKIFPKLSCTSDVDHVTSPDELVTRSKIFEELLNQLKNKRYNREYSKEWDYVYRWFFNKSGWRHKLEYVKSVLSHRNEEDNLGTKTVHMLYGENLVESVSRLEKFTACPFGFYVQYGLGAKERSVYKLTPPDIGTFLHAVIDVFSKEVSKGDITWRTFEFTWCETCVSNIIDDMLDKMKGQVILSSKRYVTLIKRLKRVVTKTIWIIARQIRNSSFNPVGYEVGFGEEEVYPPIEIVLDTGEKVHLTGRIDRIDEFKQGDDVYIRIIDYKSGNKKFSLSDVYYGLQIQLMTYLDAIWDIRDNIKPAGVLYLKLDDPMIKEYTNMSDEEIEQRVLKELKMNGLVVKDKDVIRNMDNSIDGTSLYIPASIKKDGEIGDKTSGASYKQFDMLRRYIRRLLKDLCTEIVKGKVMINPYKQKNRTACDYCKFLAVCQMEKEDSKYRVIPDKKDVWSEIDKKEGI